MGLNGLRDAKLADKALFLDVSVCVCVCGGGGGSGEEISPCILRPSKEAFTNTGGLILAIQSLKRTKGAGKDKFTLCLSLNVLPCPPRDIFLIRHSWFPGFKPET